MCLWFYLVIIFLLFVGCWNNTYHVTRNNKLLGVGDVLGEVAESLGLLTVVDDGDGGGSNNLLGVALGVEGAEAGPLTELLGGRAVHDRDLLLLAKSLDELLVGTLIAGFVQEDNLGAAGLDGLGAFVETTDDTVGEHGVLEDQTDGMVDVFDLDDLVDNDGFFLDGASVRHDE